MKCMTEEEYTSLKDNDLFLEALEEAGVYNWEGIDYAIKIYAEKQKEQERKE